MRLGVKRAGISLVACAAIGSVVIATGARAEEALRWKFKVGEKLNYNAVQDGTMTFPQVATKVHQEMDMLWEVLGVDEKGDAVIRQKFERINMKAEGPIPIEYDSKSEVPPSGLGAMIAPLYKSMTEGDFEITMTSRGEVKDVKIPEQVQAALKTMPEAAAMGEMGTVAGFKKMLSEGTPVWPEKSPKEGEHWSTKVAVDNPQMGGVQTTETIYTYKGIRDIDGTKYAVIKPERKIAFESKAAQETKATPGEPKQPAAQQQVQAKVKEQKSDGEVLFNVREGRLHSISLNQNVTIDVAGSEPPMEIKIDQKIDVKVTPAGEKAGEAKKPASSGAKAEKSEKTEKAAAPKK